MARSVQVIQQQLVDNLVIKMAAIGITINPLLWSRRNLLNLICNVVAIGVATFEQIQDAYKVDVQNIADTAAPQTGQWFQAQSFKFQFDATVPQIVQLDISGIDGAAPTFAPYYETVNTDFQIIKYCSVTIGGLGNVIIKVAKGDTPTPLTGGGTGELAAFQSYINTIGTPGIYYSATSLASDKIYIAADIYYRGEYSAIISDTVIAAINAYLAAIPFDGSVRLTDIEIAIMAVAGVNDVVLNTVRARPNSVTYPAGTILINSNLEVQRSYPTLAGYIIPETASGGTLLDTLTFIPQ